MKSLESDVKECNYFLGLDDFMGLGICEFVLVWYGSFCFIGFLDVRCGKFREGRGFRLWSFFLDFVSGFLLII